MRSQDIWVLAALVLVVLVSLYAAVVGSDYNSNDTPLDNIVNFVSGFEIPKDSPEPEKKTGGFKTAPVNKKEPEETPKAPVAKPAPAPERAAEKTPDADKGMKEVF